MIHQDEALANPLAAPTSTQAGSDLPQAGSDLPQVGSDLPQAGSDLPQAGSDTPQLTEGIDILPGETESQYIFRQRRLQEQAREKHIARMKRLFPRDGKFLMIYICNFHVLSHFLLESQ
jgi:hypothetical protein